MQGRVVFVGRLEVLASGHVVQLLQSLTVERVDVFVEEHELVQVSHEGVHVGRDGGLVVDGHVQLEPLGRPQPHLVRVEGDELDRFEDLVEARPQLGDGLEVRMIGHDFAQIEVLEHARLLRTHQIAPRELLGLGYP